jgi:protein-L-isoaspartate(D-aspartate) O-methyltransferase
MTAIDKAFKEVKRANFLPKSVRLMAGFDSPIGIGHGQTNSQPTTVRMMLEWLDVQSDQKVLDVGSGSGWTTALLAHIVGPDGKVYAVERVPELLEFGRQNCAKLGLSNVEFSLARKTFGLPEYAPYDRILVSASADKFPSEFVDQLKTGGKLVIPVQHSILEVIKLPKAKIQTIDHPGFVFVPLIK